MIRRIRNFFNSSESSDASAHDSLFGLPAWPEKSIGKDPIAAATDLTDMTAKAVANFSAAHAYGRLTDEPEEVWMERGRKRALTLFHAAAKDVPAYKDFLKKHQITPGKVNSFEDFTRIPCVDKENYLRQYPLEMLCWHGNLPFSQMISVSSGSSGQPFFWPRNQILDAETALEHELFLTSHFELDKHSTLFVVCFAMGMYIAGPITLSSILRMGEKGYPVTAVTPGYSPDDVLRVIPELAPKYDQVVLAGYPPYIKEIIDKGIDRQINWKDIKMRFLLAGEGFNETWRTYVAQLSGGKSPVHDFINLYGTADAAVVAHETPASITVRRRVAEDIDARRTLFKEERMPSFLQFYPEHKYFEEVDNELIFTAPSGIPLVRYNVHDSGGVLTKNDIVTAIPTLEEYFANLQHEKKLWNLPFVYVYGKSDQTVILYGANIYPENIKQALESGAIREFVTGRFSMDVELDENRDQKFVLEVERAEGIDAEVLSPKQVSEVILRTLIATNSEFKTSYGGSSEKMRPHVTVNGYREGTFAGKNIKHSWRKKR